MVYTDTGGALSFTKCTFNNLGLADGSDEQTDKLKMIKPVIKLQIHMGKQKILDIVFPSFTYVLSYRGDWFGLRVVFLGYAKT